MPQVAVQDYIISKLKNADVLRYRDLRPLDTPNDLFNYHLKALIAKGIVDKIEGGYLLSAKGHEYVADVFHTNDQANRLFKINVITIVSRKQDGELQILNQERHSQPSYGVVGVMGGTVLKGEAVLEGATRKLKQETGLDASFRLVGLERRRLHKDGSLFSDVLFPIAYASEYQGELQDETEFGRNFWVSIDDAINNDARSYDSIAAIPKVLRSLKEGSLESLPLFYDETIQREQ
jgi:ADP-ribose pyrophosphatase YjhB (NUDIX family)